LNVLGIKLVLRSEQRAGVDLAIDDADTRDSGDANNGIGDNTLDPSESVTQPGDASQRLGRVNPFLIPISYQPKVAQFHPGRRVFAFGKLLKVGRVLRSAVESLSYSRYEEKGTDRDGTGERDDEARVSDGKPQKVSY
jgi:hypothetical protein